MPHDAFISHAHEDRTIANAVVGSLESAGVRCWIAPRDVTPGAPWGGEIMRAITGSRVMVLIFSGQANRSAQILREVEFAVDRGVIVIPFRIEDIGPGDDLAYYIRSLHWLDAMTPPLDHHIERMVGVVQRVLAADDGDTEREPLDPDPVVAPKPDGDRGRALGPTRQEQAVPEAARERGGDWLSSPSATALLPNPRSYAATAIGLASTLSLPAGVGWALLMAGMEGEPLAEWLPWGLGFGALFGITFGCTMAYFLKGETAAADVGDREVFVARLNVALTELGYHPATQNGDFLTYKPSFQAGLMAGRIAVQLQDDLAVIVGPRLYVRRLLKKLES